MNARLLLLREKWSNKSVGNVETPSEKEKTARLRRDREKQSAVAVAVGVVRWWCAWTLECTTTSWLVHSGVQPGQEVSV